MSFIIPFLAPLAAATSVVSKIYSASSQNSAAKQQAQEYQSLALKAQEDAKKQAEAIQKSAKDRIGNQRSSFSASGISLDSGSILGALENTYQEGQQDAQQALNQGHATSLDYLNKANNTKKKGQTSYNQSLINTAGSLLK